MKLVLRTDLGTITSNSISLPQGEPGPRIIGCSVEDYIEPTAVTATTETTEITDDEKA